MRKSRTRRLAATFVLGAAAVLGARELSGSGQANPAAEPPDLALLRSRLALVSRVHPQTGVTIAEGTFAVPEDRTTGKGRIIHLAVVVLCAKSATPRPDPLFVFAGGPGSDVTQSQRGYLNAWQQQERDVVLVSQRGTGGDNRLGCGLAADDTNIQGCLTEIQRRFLDAGTTDKLDVSCAADIRPAKFQLTVGR